MQKYSTYLNQTKFMPWIMWSLGAVFFGYEFLLQVSPSVMVNDLMREFSVNATALGNLSAFYLYAYSIMQIPVGILLDRLGTRRLLTLACATCAIGALVFASAKSFYIASAGRFLIGFGSSFAVVSGMNLAATWLPINRFALTTGLLMTIGFIGAVCGQSPLSLLVAHMGWRHTLMIFSIIGMILCVLIWSLIRDRPLPPALHHEMTKTQFFSGLGFVLSNRQTWIVAIYAGLMYLPTPAFAALWGVPFLMETYALPRTEAALIISTVYIGFAIGSPFFGWLSDYIGLRRRPMIIATLGALVSLLFILYSAKLPLVLMGICLFGFGFFSSGGFIAFTVARETNPTRVTATALGFVNTLNTIGGAIAQPVVGLLLDLHWHGEMVNGVRRFTGGDYHFALAVLPICIVISLLLLPWIKETHCHNHSR